MREKHLIAAVLLVNSLSISSAALAQETIEEDAPDGWYLNLGEVNSNPENTDNEEGYNFSAAIGYKTNSLNNVRIETELTFENQDPTDFDNENATSKLGLMANLFYDFNEGSNFQPYIGAGAGIANITANYAQTNLADEQSYNLPAYQALAGISYKSEEYPDASAHIGYKYVAIPTMPSALQILEKHAYSHNLEAGVKVDF